MVKLTVIDKIDDFLKSSNIKKINILYGSAGSGKSKGVALFLTEKFLIEKNKHFLITRKTNPALKITCWQMILDIITKINVPVEINRSDQSIRFGKNLMIFKSMDNPEKIKSAEFNYIWMEEATEFTIEDYRQLMLRLRRATNTINQMFLTFNPIKSSWIYSEFFEKENEDAAILHLLYTDNPFLSEEYIRTLESLKHQDETYYKIYTLGEFAEVQGLVYQNYRVEKFDNFEYDEIIAGLDFGYNNPSAYILIGIKDDEVFIFDEIYRTQLTTPELITLIKEKNEEWGVNPVIYCEHEPDRNKEIEMAGLRVFEAKKDVIQGINFLKTKKIHIHERCVNTIKEFKTYKYKEDRAGNILEEPVKLNDHAVDAIRYAVYTYYKTGKPDIIFF